MGSGIKFHCVSVVRKELDRKFEGSELSKPSILGMPGLCQAWLGIAGLASLVGGASTLGAGGLDTATQLYGFLRVFR
jgi:hypothetical protein